MKKRILIVIFTVSLLLLATGQRRENSAVSNKSEGWVVSAAPANTLVSFHKPDGLILSEGNIYFTSHDASLATVWRTAQGSSPGHESVIYCEPDARFGDIVFAKVGGNFFGYFFATTGNGATMTIKRIPLSGGAATALATISNVDIANSHRNLITDGVDLFWQDDTHIRKMPIGGGAITVLDNTSPNTPTAGLALQVDRIIYASVADVRFVHKTGDITAPQVRTIARASTTVTALHAVSNGVYWGERTGAVRLKVGATVTTLPSIAGLVPTSVSTNGFTAGGAQAWTQCGSQTCRMQFAFPSTNFQEAIGADAFGVTVTSSGNVFWGDAAGVHRQTF